MAQTTYSVTVDDAYVAPTGPMTKEQYVVFVLNRAAQSYQGQYKAADTGAGVQAACDAYNAALPADPAPAG